MPEKTDAGKGRPQKEPNRKGAVASPGTDYEFATEITTPGTKTTGPARGTAGTIRGKEQKKPAAEE